MFNSCQRACLVVMVALVLPLAPSGADGATGDCVTFGKGADGVNHPEWYDTRDKKTVKVNYNTLAAIPNVSQAELYRGLILAIETWNEHAAAGGFRVGGTTTLTALPEFKTQCDALGINYSLIHVVDNIGPPGEIAMRCKDESNPRRAHQFEIRLHTRLDDPETLGEYRQWGFTTIPPASEAGRDIVGTVAHELGHGLGLGHPADVPQQEGAIMGRFIEGTTNRREPYFWDLKCGKMWSDVRQTGAYRRILVASAWEGGTTEPSPFLGTWLALKTNAGVTKQWGSWEWSAAMRLDGGVSWTRGHNQMNTLSADSTLYHTYTGAQVVDSVWRENEGIQRALYLDPYEDPLFGLSAEHRVRWVKSTDGFATKTGGWLFECLTMSGWFTCAGWPNLPALVYAAHTPNVAWDNYTNRTVFVWTRQERGDAATDHEVRVAVGHLDDQVLPASDTLGVRSTVRPGVACTAFAAVGSYDCLVAYVDKSDPDQFVRIKAFYASTGTQKYNLVINPTVYNTNLRAFNQIALWRHDSKFWLAIKDYGTDYLLVYVSTDGGASWSFHSGPGTGLYNGPSVAAYWTGNNALSYTK